MQKFGTGAKLTLMEAERPFSHEIAVPTEPPPGIPAVGKTFAGESRCVYRLSSRAPRRKIS